MAVIKKAYTSVPYVKLLNQCFLYLHDNFFAPIIGRYAFKKKIYISLNNNGPTAYCNYRKGFYNIVINRALFFELVKPADYLVNQQERKQVINDTIMLFMSLFYHEFGHVLYTAFDLFDKLVKKQIPNEEQFMYSHIINVLEDPFVEKNVSFKIRKSRRFFAYKTEKCIASGIDKWTDAGTAASFAQYLLGVLFVGRQNIPNQCQFYEDNQPEIKDFVMRYYSETDAELREDIGIEFCDFLKSKGMDLSVPDSDKSQTTAPRGNGAPGPAIAAPCPSYGGNQCGGSTGSCGSGQAGGGTQGQGGKGQGQDLGTVPGNNGNNGAGGAGNCAVNGQSDDDADDGTGSGDIPDEDSEEDKANMTSDDFEGPTVESFESLDSEASLSANHIFVNAKDSLVQSGASERELDEIFSNNLIKFSKLIEDCCEAIDRFESMHKITDVPGYQSGKFSVKQYCKGRELRKCFTRPSGYDVTPELVACCLTDVSGSMSGIRSRICAQAMCVLYECFARLEIPFEMSGFTTANYSGYGDDAETVVYKGFDDDANECRKYVPLLDSYNSSKARFANETLGMFSGTLLEVNLFYEAKRLLARGEKDKVCIVISDGETNGDERRLVEIIEDLESNGVMVLGIGICCNAVERCFKNHISLTSTEELERLPEELGNFLVSLYTKNI